MSLPVEPEIQILENLLMFLIEQANKRTCRMSARELAKNFKKGAHSLTIDYVECLINRLKLNLRNTRGIAFETRIRMLYMLGYKIDEEYLEELQVHGTIELNEKRWIKVFKANNTSFELGRIDQVPLKRASSSIPKICQNISKTTRSSRIKLTQGDIMTLANVIIEKLDESNAPFDGNTVFVDEFTRKCGKGSHFIHHQVPFFLAQVPGMKGIDFEAKVKILFALSSPITRDFLNEISSKGDVQVDTNHRIIKFTSHNGKFELAGSHSKEKGSTSFVKCAAPSRKEKEGFLSKTLYTKDESSQLLEFLLRKSQNPIFLLNFTEISRDYIVETGSNQSVNDVLKMLYLLRQNIPNMDNIDTKTKVKLMFSTGAPVHEPLLNVFEKDALVVLDADSRIIKYKSTDDSLNLAFDLNTKKKGKIFEHVGANKEAFSKMLFDENVISFPTTGGNEKVPDEDFPSIRAASYTAISSAEFVSEEVIDVSGSVTSCLRAVNESTNTTDKFLLKSPVSVDFPPSSSRLFSIPNFSCEIANDEVALQKCSESQSSPKIAPFTKEVSLTKFAIEEENVPQSSSKPTSRIIAEDHSISSFVSNESAAAVKKILPLSSSGLNAPNSHLASVKPETPNLGMKVNEETKSSVKRGLIVKETLTSFKRSKLVSHFNRKDSPVSARVTMEEETVSFDEDDNDNAQWHVPLSMTNDFNSSLIPESAAVRSINLIDYLKMLRTFAETLEVESLHVHKKKINEKIDIYKGKNLKIPIRVVSVSLESFIHSFSKTSNKGRNGRVTIKETLTILRSAIYNLSTLNIHQINTLLNETDEVCYNRRVSIKEIQSGLNHCLEVVLPV